MASYAMAHLKLDMLLAETGFHSNSGQRFRVFLTNSLEEHHPETGTLFASWLSQEANEANYIKRDTPVMVVLGNPPYSVSSSNKSQWIENLVADYKKDLNEKNIQPLSDDYIKFIRFGQHFIDKNGEGILAYISNNSFINGLIHRQMRKKLLESFDKIYILDLHGNSKKKEVSPDGSADQNVFDIMQGVSINIFIKTGRKKSNELSQVFHYDLFGQREYKYHFLNEKSLNIIEWNNLTVNKLNFFFVQKDFQFDHTYQNGFLVNSLFKLTNTGIETGRDEFFIDFSYKALSSNVKNVFDNLYNDKFIKCNIDNANSFKLKDNLRTSVYNKNHIQKIHFRPFDNRYTYYDITLQRRPSYNTIRHVIKNNIALSICRQSITNRNGIFVSRGITDRNYTGTAAQYGAGIIFPLYLYPDSDHQITTGGQLERTPNLNKDIVNQIAAVLGLSFTSEKENREGTFAPIDLLDYIYAVLHNPSYREKYKEFLKIDFPRVPYPDNQDTFWQLVALGGELRQIHLLESPVVDTGKTQYPVHGTNEVEKIRYQESKVFINDAQYFDGVPLVAWEFYIGGYQPAQKWLKDRKGRTLSFDDVKHYQRIIVALTETDRIMKEIDTVEHFD